MKNGFILPIVETLVSILKWLNVVEWMKVLAMKSVGSKAELPKQIAAANFAIDLYQILKWGLIVGLWSLGFESNLSLALAYYLIAANLFSYFYYHGWAASPNVDKSTARQRRRFVNLVSAIAFYIVAFAYLYHSHFPEHLVWAASGQPTVEEALLFSVGSALPIKVEVAAKTTTAQVLVLVEAINTFVFLAILLANSIPQAHKGEG